MKITVKPRDLREGDLIQRLNDDFTIGYRAITEITKVSGRYKISTDDGVHMYRSGGQALEVLRGEEGDR